MLLLIDGWSDALGMDQLPTFIGQVENKTVTAGRAAVLTCTVKDLATLKQSKGARCCQTLLHVSRQSLVKCQIAHVYVLRDTEQSL